MLTKTSAGRVENLKERCPSTEMRLLHNDYKIRWPLVQQKLSGILFHCCAWFLTAAASRRWVSKLLLNSWGSRDKSPAHFSRIMGGLHSADFQFFTSRAVHTSEHPWGAAILFSNPSKLHNLLCNSTNTPFKEDTRWLQFRDAGIILLLASLSNGNIVDLWKTQST